MTRIREEDFLNFRFGLVAIMKCHTLPEDAKVGKEKCVRTAGSSPTGRGI